MSYTNQVMLENALSLIEQQAARIAELEARIAAAEPAGYFLHIASSWAQVSKEFKNDSDVVPLYAAPVASGPRYDWSVSGMKQSDTGNWVMAGEGDKE